MRRDTAARAAVFSRLGQAPLRRNPKRRADRAVEGNFESYQLDDAAAEARYEGIMARWSRATQRVGLALHNHDNVEAAKEAYETVSNRYAERFPGIPT